MTIENPSTFTSAHVPRSGSQFRAAGDEDASRSSNALSNLVAALRHYDRILVTGPQRAGTTIAARMLAAELNYKFVPEEQVGFDNLEKLFDLYRNEKQFVLQGPCFCPYAHLVSGAVVLMRRPVPEILSSQARISWPEEAELDRYFTTQGPIAQVKYDAWDNYQKPQLRERGFELDYQSLSRHPLWLEKEQRQAFKPRQISLNDEDESLAELQRRIQLHPNDAECLSELGQALQFYGRFEQAIDHLQRAIKLKPDFPEAYLQLGQALANVHRGAEAVLCFRQALRLKPDFAEAHKQLGDVLYRRRGTSLDDVVSCYREAIRCRRDYADVYDRLGCVMNDLGLPEEAVEEHRRASQFRPDSAKLLSSYLFSLHCHPEFDPRRLTEEHEVWNERHAKPLARFIQPHHNEPDPNRKLRVGYVSQFFRNHPVGRFLLPLLAAQDRAKFEIICYSSCARHDEVTRRLEAHADLWRETAELTDDFLTELIRHDSVDILVDLDAHAPDNRLLTFARQPAPVQVTYAGYCSTTGLDTIDYRLTDPCLDPPHEPQNYKEESVYLPNTYWVYEPPAELPEVGPLPALANGSVTFGCLNDCHKVTPAVLAAWRDLLANVPGSRLLFYARHGSHRDRILSFFAEQQIEPGRVEFDEFGSSSRYFANYRRIDIGLDPFPWAGSMTTCDALWMGIPVVTLTGKTAVNRGGVSILTNAGFPELIAETSADYVRIAADLATDLPRLAKIRACLRQQMQNSALMDGPRLARQIEATFRKMWERWCSRKFKSAGISAGSLQHHTVFPAAHSPGQESV